MIEGKNINLRTVRKEEIEIIHKKTENINGKGKYYPIGFGTLESARKSYAENGWWDHKGRGTLVVTDKSDRIIGRIRSYNGLSYQGLNTALEIGAIVFDENDRGKGIMTEAVKIFCAYLFELMDIQRIQGNTVSGNNASLILLQKCGFTKEGVMRNLAFHKGKYVDIELFSLLRNECPSLQEVLETL